MRVLELETGLIEYLNLNLNKKNLIRTAKYLYQIRRALITNRTKGEFLSPQN